MKMIQKNDPWKRRALALFLFFALMVHILSGSVVGYAQSEEKSKNVTEDTYVGRGFEAEFKVTSIWDGHFNAEIKLTNTGKETIHDWTIYCDADFEIENIWNAKLISEEDNPQEDTESEGYTIDNVDWNQDIAPGETRVFGFTAGYEGVIHAPSSYQMQSFLGKITTDRYQVTYKENSDWGAGFTGEITIKNIGEEEIEDWELYFDFDRNIQ